MKYILVFFWIVLFLSCKEVKRAEPKIEEIVANPTVTWISEKARSGILVCAHRSYHKNYPENSIQSIRDAINAGIDFVELDVRTTRDSMLVLMHDETIDRTTTGSGKVSEFTYTELQAFFLKAGDAVSSYKIPLVRQALTEAKGKVVPNLDLKAVKYQQLYELLKACDMQDEVISFIGDREKVFEMIAIDSLYATLPLSETKEEMIMYAANTSSRLQHFTERSYTRQNMKWANDNGQLVFVNTLWDEDVAFAYGNTAGMDSIISLHPAIIQTDHPKLLIDHLRNKGLHK